MKRKDIIEKLLSEGFSEKTLSRMGDKELAVLAKTVLKEEDVMISKKDPLLQQKVTNAKKSNQTIVTYEEESKEGKSKEEEESNEWSHVQKENEVESWVLNLAEEKFSNFTKKSEIMEIISSKVKETPTPMPATKANKGHNGIPEFMSYDAIVSTQPSPSPAQPDIDTPTKPGTPEKPSKPKTPYEPGPGTNPKPKAMGEEKSKK
jgi:hypothetical protein